MIAMDMNQKSNRMQRLLQARCQPCMNNNFRICLFMLLLAFVSCKKEQQQMLSNPGNSIVGKWELRKNYGSLPPQYYDAGNGNIMQFTDSTYQVTANNQVLSSGTYKLLPDSTGLQNVCLVVAESFKNRIVFDGNTSQAKVFVSVSGTKLAFLSGCFALDGGWGKDYEMIATK
jgi:hypothetical protein